ncbi:MAG TPA: DUF433 domain-containing protein [Gemmataceae bacterium]|nr:DUF433 domain-containing protein [Gemmataceae bacterium]
MSTTTSAGSTIPVIREHIAVIPRHCGGKPHIADHRIKVQHIAAWHERLGLSADEIVAEYPGLTLAGVYAALAYYHDHRDEIDADRRADDQFIAAARVEASPSLLRLRAGATRAAGHPIPPR